ncbi:SCO1664 family protein [Brevibacterium sp. 50QC2O2]|uniref:SCO1664 family protein n=1 Tax=Brevibacterium sp. 50QC2O2 TaxID=2968459 RepID=UPI00211C942F|nr:SCO1664 family protein [Brevibacterium sp. 50QC2O2]MCQ9388857.1 SCO1664 family protein [Brevibacterium sp. 50QC2O2]
MTPAELLDHGRVEVFGEIPGASNATYLVSVEADGSIARAVLKPRAGARPLHDFDVETLPAREVAAFELSRFLGLDCVPPTVLREDLGELSGSLQAYVSASGGQEVDVYEADRVPADVLPVFRAQGDDGSELVIAHTPAVRRIALLDLLMGNADRKGGHVLTGSWDPQHRAPGVYGIDNGLSLATGDRLRTLLWGFAGEPLTVDEVGVLRAAADVGAVAHVLGPLLTADEVAQVAVRATALLGAGEYPYPPTDRYPLPWPPF